MANAQMISHSGRVFTTTVVSLNIPESGLFADFVKRLKNDVFPRVRLNEERARANAIIKIIKIALLLYFDLNDRKRPLIGRK